MGKKLLLLTKTFPFASGEEFLEAELPIIASSFDNTLIIATAKPSGALQTRKVPENVKVIGLSETRNKYWKYTKYVVKGLSEYSSPNLKNEFANAKTNKAKLGSVYFEGRCKSILSKLQQDSIFKEFIGDQSSLLVYSYWFSDLPYLALLIKKLRDGERITRIISRAHGYDLYDYRNASGRIPFREIVLSGIDKVFPCSKDGKDYLAERYPQYKDKIETSYLGTKDNGVNMSQPHHVFSVVTCSAIIPLKRLMLLAEAIGKIDDQNIDWICIGDGSQLPELKSYCDSNIHKAKVEFLGRLTNDDVLKLYKERPFDLFVNVSESEGLPVSIMEAISFGIPCLATDVGGTREIVENGLNGYLLPKDLSAETLAKNIHAMYNIPKEEYSLMRKNARLVWEKHFDADLNYGYFVKELSDYIW